MSTIMDLYVNLIGNDVSLIAATKRSGAALTGMGAESAGLGDKMDKLKAASALALSAIAGYSVDLATKFQSEMELLHTQAQIPQRDIKGISQAVLNMAATVGQAPDELAKGLYHIYSAGFRGNQAMQMLYSASQLTAIGMGNMEDSSQAIIGVMAAKFPDVMNSSAQAMAFLNTIAGIGDMRLSDLATSIGTGVLSSFKSAGLEMKDFGAGMATLTDNVTPPQVAATRLRMAIALLSGPSGVATKALESVGLSASAANKAFKDEKYLGQYGINMTQLSADLHKPNGLLVAIMDLKTHLKASGLTAVEQSAVITRAFGGARTAAGIETLINESDRLTTKYKQLGSASSRTKKEQDAWAQQQKTFKQQLDDLRSGVEAMAIKLGDMLLPTLTKIVSYLNGHQSQMKTFFTMLLIFLGLLTAAWIAEGIAMIAANWELMLAIAVIILIVVAIYELFKHWKTIWNWIKGIAKDVWGWLKDAWNATWGFIKRIALDVWHWLVSAWKDTLKAIKATVFWVKDNIIDPIIEFFVKYLINPFKFIMAVFVKGWNTAWTIVKDVILFVWGFISTIVKSIATHITEFLLPYVVKFERAWNAIWNAVAKFFRMVWNSWIKPVVDAIAQGFEWLWGKISDGAWWLHGKLKSAQSAIKRDVFDKLEAALHFVGQVWDALWHDASRVFEIFWSKCKMVWGYIQRDGIDKLENGLHWLEGKWNSMWTGMGNMVKKLWDKISPIFGKILGAFDKFKNALSNIGKAPGAAGSHLAHILGFDTGGRVPGSQGTAQLAVVHGGEYVLSNDMQAGRAPMTGLGHVFTGQGTMGAVAAASGGSNGVDHFTIVVDGKALFDFVVQRAQRNARRNTTTFLS